MSRGVDRGPAVHSHPASGREVWPQNRLKIKRRPNPRACVAATNIADGTGRVINISGIAGVILLLNAMTHGLNNSAMNQVSA